MMPSRFSSSSAWLNWPTVSMKMPQNTVVAIATAKPTGTASAPSPGDGSRDYSLRRLRRCTLWSGPLRTTSVARPRVGATFSSRLGLLMVRQVVRA